MCIRDSLSSASRIIERFIGQMSGQWLYPKNTNNKLPRKSFSVTDSPWWLVRENWILLPSAERGLVCSRQQAQTITMAKVSGVNVCVWKMLNMLLIPQFLVGSIEWIVKVLALFPKKKCAPMAARILAISLGSALRNENYQVLHLTPGTAVVLQSGLKVGNLQNKDFRFLAQI